MILPRLKHRSGIRTSQQVNFGGLNHLKSASEGDVYDMLNMSSKDYPLLSTRDKRQQISSGEDIKAVGDRWIIKGTDFIYDGEVKNEHMPLSDTPKTVVEMGAYVLIFPDKCYYNTEADKPFLKDVYELTIKSKDGSYEFDGQGFLVAEDLTNIVLDNIAVYVETSAGWSPAVVTSYDFTPSEFISLKGRTGNILIGGKIKTAKGFGRLQVSLSGTIGRDKDEETDLIEGTGGSHYALVQGIREGDGLLLRQGEQEQTAIVKGVSNDSIEIQYGTVEVWEGEMEVLRNIPDFEWICVCENRLWGVCEGTIYASKLGDPKNFYVYQGLSTDSWAVDYLTKAFTGAITYNGRPTFWTEDSVITIYGSTPSTYQATETSLIGVLDGKTMAVAGGYLYYLSPNGMCVYGGRYPTDIHVPIGEKIGGGYGFSDGNKYYIDTGEKLYVYDPSVHLWHIEDSTGVCNYNTKDGLLSIVTNNGDLLGFTGEGEEVIESFVEFGDFYVGTGNKKAMSKLNIRIEAVEGAEIDILVKYDSAKEWQKVKTLTATEKRSYYIPFVPRRCDHYRLRIEGTGDYTVYSMSRENYTGTAN